MKRPVRIQFNILLNGTFMTELNITSWLRFILSQFLKNTNLAGSCFCPLICWAGFPARILKICESLCLSFKTLEMRAAQSSAGNLMNASKIHKFENQKFKARFWRPTFSEGRQKLTGEPRTLMDTH